MGAPPLISAIEDTPNKNLDKKINDMLDSGVNVHLVNKSSIVNYEPTSGNNNALMISANYSKYIKPATYLRLIQATLEITDADVKAYKTFSKNQRNNSTVRNNMGINAENTKGETALNLFASTDDMEDTNEAQNDDVAEEVVSMLLDNGADPNIGAGNYNKTPLYNALTHGNMAISMALVNTPTLEVNNTHGGSTYLVEAVKKNMLEIIQILLQKGADINRKAPTSGETPLIAAVNIPTNIEYYPQEQQETFIIEREAIIGLLLQHNADRSIIVGGTPAIVANNNANIEAQNAIQGRTAHNIASNPDLPDFQRLRPEIIAQLVPPLPPLPQLPLPNNGFHNNINLANAETIGYTNSSSTRSYNSNSSNKNNNLQGGKRGKRKTRKTKPRSLSNKRTKKTRRTHK